MYPGRSAWTRGVLALGVGALFLLGWRIDTAGDALSASTPIDSDRNYFSVAVASSRSRGSRHDDHGKKEERPGGDRLGIERQDRQASRGDYSTGDQETGTPSDVHRNAEPDGEHGAGYSAESSLPLRNLERNDRSMRYLDGRLRTTENSERNDPDSKRSSAIGSILVRNDGRNDGKSDSGLKNHAVDESAPSWKFEENDEDFKRNSVTDSFLVKNDKRNDGTDNSELKSYMVNESPLSWKLEENDRKDSDEKLKDYSVISSTPLRNVKDNDVKTDDVPKNYAIDESLPLWKLEGNDREDGHFVTKSIQLRNVKDNDVKTDGGSKNYAMDELLSSWKFEENNEKTNNKKLKDYDRTINSIPLRNIEKNDDKSNDGSENYMADKLLPAWNFEASDRKKGNQRSINHMVTSYSTTLQNVKDNDDKTTSRSKSHVVDLERDAEDEGNFESVYYSMEKPLPSWNAEESDLAENEGNHGSISDLIKSSFPSWDLERHDDKDDRSKSYLIEERFTSRSFGKNDDRRSTSHSVSSSFPLWNVERNDVDSKSYALDKSFPSWNPQRKGGIKDERDGDYSSYSTKNTLPLSSFERSDHAENENNKAKDNGDSFLSWNLNRKENNRNSLYYSTKIKNEDNGEPLEALFQSKNLKTAFKKPKSRDTLESINHSIENLDKSDPANNDYRSATYPQENFRLASTLKKIDSMEKDRESTSTPITKKNEHRSMENSLQPWNVETIEHTENEHGSTRSPITKRNDPASLDDPKRRSHDDGANYTVFRSSGLRGRQDESRFSKDDEETRDSLNGSTTSERSDVKENLSREVNGRSMNEAGKSLGLGYYSNVGNDLSLTLRSIADENDGEIEEPAKAKTMKATNPLQRYLRALENESTQKNIKQDTKQKVPPYNFASSFGSSEEDRILWNITDRQARRNQNERSISREIQLGEKRNGDVGLLDEIGDFHNSDRGIADRVEGYKRDEESIQVDSPAATRRFAGMQRDRGLFFRGNPTRSSAKTSFRSRKGRFQERDRGNILERGTRETRSSDRSPEASDPSVDFRVIDRLHGYGGTFDGHEITDREDREDSEVRGIGDGFFKLRKDEDEFSDKRITKDSMVFDKLSATRGVRNLQDGFMKIWKSGREPELESESFDFVNKINGARKSKNNEATKRSGSEKLPDLNGAVGKFENEEIFKQLSLPDKLSNIQGINFRSKIGSKNKMSRDFLRTKTYNSNELSQRFSNVQRSMIKLGLQSENLFNPSITMQDFENEDLRDRSKGSNMEVRMFGTDVKSGEKESLSLFRKADFHREKRFGIRRKRYTNYYSPQSVAPMAYVHIQPSYPVAAAPAPNRKCVHCMVVYKPCPSPPRLPPWMNLPTYKYQELASNWRGLKYGCRCNSIGSLTTACDIVTGQCQCKLHVAGRQCDQCMIGFWGLTTGAGCAPCGCDPIGAYNSSCHDTIGQCYCKPGVGGSRCDTCLPGYYGFSSNGCQVCDPCVRPGHICDPDTGRCVCPTLTFGEHCDRCRPGSWNLVPGVGCKPCACTLGSTRPHCDHQGQCPCRIGYDGLSCERCAKGYYGYPRCRPCNCNVDGTLLCDNETCDCNESGQCPCKEHVIGRRCNICKEGTFGLAAGNPKGCTECFCFGKTTSCRQAGLSWGQRRLKRPRILYANDTSNDIIVSKFRSQIYLSSINGGLNVTNGLSTIPDIEGDVTIPSTLYYNYPLYWMLPESFLGDKVVSYGGFLKFTTTTEGGIPLRSSFQYPIVQMQGNKIVLEYYLPAPANNDHYEVRFHESLWQLQNRPDYKVSREVLMVTLQNLQYILVKASNNAEFTKTTLVEASLDVAVPTPTHTPALAIDVEICDCPPEYNNTSCQDPSIGYYRWHNNNTVTSTIVINLVGESKPCQCNGRSDICDIETGCCLDCHGNTAGSSCDICADSFYGHPDFGCNPCPCPQTDKRFSNTCMVFANIEPICICKPGYTGRKCERCASGYYGFPHLPDGKCIPCNCNHGGSLSDECDTETGQCRCRAGSTGRDCSECTAYRHVYINNVCTSCNDNCTGVLLDTVAELSQQLKEGTTHIANGYIPPPWDDLLDIDSNASAFLEIINLQNELKQRMKNIPWNEYRKLLKDVEAMLKSANEQTTRAETAKSRANDLKNNIFSSKIDLDKLKKYLKDTIMQLNQYSNDNKRIEIKKALELAKAILNHLKGVSLNLPKKTMDLERFLKNVTKYADWLNSLYDPTKPLALAQDKTKNYTDKLNDMRKIIENTMETLFTYDGLYNNINETLLEGRKYCNEIKILHNTINDSITEGKKLTNEIRGFIVDFKNNVEDLPELRNKLTYWFDKLSKKEELLDRLNYEYNNTYMIPALAHVKNLSDYVDQYVSLFSETRNIAASPLKASQAYKNIVDSIRTANITAKEAKKIAEDTYNKTFPNGPKSKSLLDIAKEKLLASSEQKDRAEKYDKLVQNANDGLELQSVALNTLEDTLNNTEIRNNEINEKLQMLGNDSKKLRENVENLLKNNEKVMQKVKDSQNLIEEYNKGIANRLKPKLYELKREGDSNIGLASEKLAEAFSNIRKAVAKLTNLTNADIKRRNAFSKWNDTLATKLQNLKDKIAEARNVADGIRISLRSEDGKECSRSYRPSAWQPTSTNTIVMTFALLKGKKEGSLFYLPSSKNDDFLALEIVNKKVRFLWNVGGGTGIIVHPEVLKSGDVQNDKSWYRLEAYEIMK